MPAQNTGNASGGLEAPGPEEGAEGGAGASPLRREFRIRRPAGTIRRVSTTSEAVLRDDELPQPFIGVMLYLTERREAERANESDLEYLARDDVPTLSGAEVRGARGLLDWSLAQLAAASRVSVSTLKRMEDGSEGSTRPSKSEAVRRALGDGGVRFKVIDGQTWIGRATEPARTHAVVRRATPAR